MWASGGDGSADLGDYPAEHWGGDGCLNTSLLSYGGQSGRIGDVAIYGGNGSLKVSGACGGGACAVAHSADGVALSIDGAQLTDTPRAQLTGRNCRRMGSRRRRTAARSTASP
jgi:hypothetical protein